MSRRTRNEYIESAGAPKSGHPTGHRRTSASCRYCCKSRKLQGHEFFAKTSTEKQSPIRIASIALPKPPVSLARGDEVPHISTRKPHQPPLEFLTTCAKRLLQQNLPKPAVSNRSKPNSLFDHLIGADQHRCGKLDAEPLGGLEVDDEFEFDGPLDREIGWRGALQDLIHESRRARIEVRKIHSVVHQRAGFRLRLEPDHRQAVLQRELSHLLGEGNKPRVVNGHESPTSPRRYRRDRSGDVIKSFRLYRHKLRAQRAGRALHGR